MLTVIINVVSACLAARSDKPTKPLSPAVAIIHMCEIFLLQNKCRVAKVDKKRCLAVDLSNLAITNKCWVGKVCKNRCSAVDLATFYRKISAACILILPVPGI